MQERARKMPSVGLRWRSFDFPSGRSMHRAILIFLCLLSSPLAVARAGGHVPRASYTTATLAQPVFDPAQVAVGTARLNNWLNENYSKLTPDQMTGPREHLYYLIDSHIKHQFALTGKTFPSEKDLILETLFSWSDRLGVFGGSQIYKALPANAGHAFPTQPMPANFLLERDGEYLRVRSQRAGWTAAVPYYFMIWQLKEFTATSGLGTQLLLVSTGAAKHTKAPGHSQATLMLISSPSEEQVKFQAYWMEQFGINEKDKITPLGFNELSSRAAHDPQADLYKELVFFESGGQAFAVFYSGLGGTYEWNRPHFMDFLRALEVPQKAVTVPARASALAK